MPRHTRRLTPPRVCRPCSARLRRQCIRCRRRSTCGTRCRSVSRRRPGWRAPCCSLPCRSLTPGPRRPCTSRSCLVRVRCSCRHRGGGTWSTLGPQGPRCSKSASWKTRCSQGGICHLGLWRPSMLCIVWRAGLCSFCTLSGTWSMSAACPDTRLLDTGCNLARRRPRRGRCTRSGDCMPRCTECRSCTGCGRALRGKRTGTLLCTPAHLHCQRRTRPPCSPKRPH